LLAPPLWVNLQSAATRNYIVGGFGGYAPILATRGCPYSCNEYCTYPIQQGRKVRHTGIEKVIQDIDYITRVTGIRKFVFRDPVFSINKKYTVELLTKLANIQNGSQFTIETHLNNIDEEMVKLLSKANIKWVKFGIESSNNEVRNNVSRFSLTNDQNLDKINLFKRYGIKTVAMYILCQPSDDMATCLSTIDYSVALRTDLAQFSLFTPYPGTNFYEANKTKLNISKNYEDFSQYQLVYDHSIFNKSDAQKILGAAYNKFYLNKLKTSIIPFK